MKTCHPEDERAYLIGVIHSLDVEGDVAEVGVYEGKTAQLLKQETKDRDVYLFDTFGGIMSEHAEPPKWNTGDYATRLEEVKRLIGEDFIFHKGNVMDSKIKVNNVDFALIHIDLDVYVPLQDILPFFWERLVPGGVMLISNYDVEHAGVVRAVDEFIKPKKQKRYSRYVFLKK